MSERKHKKCKNYKKIALVLSLCSILIWTFLGTGTSLAWFADTSPVLTNIFHVASFDLEVSHRLSDGNYEPVDEETKIFDDDALYEPGYVQVAYLKVENKGSVPFNFSTAVSVTNYTEATNVLDQTFLLQDHLYFGCVIADTEAEMDSLVATRDAAVSYATTDLSLYSPDVAYLEAEGTQYVAIVLYMPKEVANEANYRKDTVPKVELGIIVKADQIRP